MSDSIRYHPEVDKLEHDDSVAPETKRVSIYGWDAENLNKVRLGVNASGGLVVGDDTSSDTAFILDDADDPVIYVGTAPIGTATSAAGWKIYKIDVTSGMVRTWADGDSDSDNIWDNRASLSYS